VPRVLQIINRLNLGGPAFHVAILTKNLQDDFEVKLISGTKQDSEESSGFIVKEMGLDFTEIKHMKRSLNPLNDYISYREIRKIIRDFKPDIIHTHAAKAGALGRLAAIHEKVPVIVHTFHGHVFHSYFHPLKSNFFLRIERYLAKRSSAIIAISERQKHELAHHYKLCKPEKIHVIPLGFDLSRFRENMEEKRRDFRKRCLLNDDELAVGIIGSLVPVKNHSMFISAAADILKRTKRKVRFFIIGDGESRTQLMREAAVHGLDYSFSPEEKRRSSLTFTSWIRNVDVCVAGLDIISLCSHNEGTPVSLIEAQAGGKPVITTNVGGIENVVSRDETAILVETNDYRSFSDNLLRLIEDDSLRNSMGAHGWDFVREKFHFTRLIRETSTLYHSLLNKKSRSRN